MEKVTVIIPCHNEEKGIGKVLDAMPFEKLAHHGFDINVVVVDNNSKDGTTEEVKKRNIKIIHEPNKGKGYALKTGFESVPIDTKYVVILDGDNTYKAEEMPRLLEPLQNNFADVIVGSRIGGKTIRGSLSTSHRIVNWLFAFLVRHFYGANITDCLSGYFAFKRESLDKLLKHLNSKGFAIEMEMITKMKKMKMDVYSVPITYDRRLGYSKISSYTDGFKILFTFFDNLTWSPRRSA
ncbi:MAG TPA: glycosyltransferase family 2 protein [Candidatus Woesebacteria bacterium]|nr:glycosyltransferase family 2 protein [Candidatus Woesebacteria bacterium]